MSGVSVSYCAVSDLPTSLYDETRIETVECGGVVIVFVVSVVISSLPAAGNQLPLPIFHWMP